MDANLRPGSLEADDNWGFSHGLGKLHVFMYIQLRIYIYSIHIHMYTQYIEKERGVCVCAPITSLLDMSDTCVSHKHGSFGIMDDPMVVFVTSSCLDADPKQPVLRVKRKVGIQIDRGVTAMI